MDTSHKKKSSFTASAGVPMLLRSVEFPSSSVIFTGEPLPPPQVMLAPC